MVARQKLGTRRWRARARLGIAAVGALAVTSGISILSEPAGGASSTPSMGTSSADAVLYSVDPREAQLSVGIAFGQADATYTNDTARSSSQGINLGTIGTALGAAQCDGSAPTLPLDQQPQPLLADSRDASAAGGKTANTDGLLDQFVKAAPTPASSSVTTMKGIDLGGGLGIGPGIATASSYFLNGVRTAKATVDLASITLPGGLSFAGLHWEVTHVSGNTTDKPSGKFTVGSATGPFSALSPVLAALDPTTLLSKLGAVLGPALGINITMPTAHLANDVLVVDPLMISVVPNSNRDALGSQLFTSAQPVRQATIDQIEKAYCKSAAVITVADIVVSSITGAGSFNLVLGGVQAVTGDVTYSNLLGGDLGGAPDLGASSNLGGALGGGGGGSGGGTSTSPGDISPAPGAAGGAASPTPKGRQAASRIKAPKGTRGGALLGIGLALLGVVLLMAEADRRTLRTAQHQIPGV